MNQPHRIRLRGPWQAALKDGGELGTYTAPMGLSACVPHDFRGTLRIWRHFHRPTGLETGTRVRLAIDATHRGDCLLNSHTLPPFTTGTSLMDVTTHLQLNNRLELQLVIDTPLPMDQPICDVWLEIDAR